MWKSLRLRPILASVLVLAFTRGALAVGVSATSAETSVYNYAGHLTFTVQGMSEQGETVEELNDFPLRVVVNEKSAQGRFGYEFLRNGTNDIVFLDTTGQSLSYEIETWNTSGDSAFWVKVPNLRDGTQIMMCWGLRDGCTAPAKNNPADVWSDYVGVWHFDEVITAEEAAETLSHDATGNGHDAKPVTYASGEGDLRDQTYSSADSVFGTSRHNSYGNQVKRGCRFEVQNSELMEHGTNFTFTGWFKPQNIVGTSSRDGAVIISRKTKQNETGGWYAQMLESQDSTRAMHEVYAQGGGADYQTVRVSDEVMVGKWTFLCLVYEGGKLTISGGNDSFTTGGGGAVTAATDNGQIISFGNYNGADNSNYCSFDGLFDEFRIRKGTADGSRLALEYAQGTNACLYVAGGMTNDAAAVLQNGWVREPSITQTVWEDGGPTAEDFDIVPQHGTNVTVVVYDRSTGEAVASGELAEVKFPQDAGSYRVVVTVAQSGSEDKGIWGALEYTLGYRVADHAGSHEFGVNVARILLGNDDYTVEGGEVEWQSYDDEDRYGGTPYWRHLDADGNDASTTYDYYWSDSYDFNLGGGTHHIYRYGDGIDRLWDLRDIRIGNTFNNGETFRESTGRDEQYAEGLAANQNYLPWNADSQRVLNRSGRTVGGSHRYVGHIVMQNTTNAAVTSTCYTNGIGTIYFDAVNGWTDNITNATGATNYRLVVEIATCSSEDSALPPKEEYVSSADAGAGIEIADSAAEPFYKAKWERWKNLRVLRFDRKDHYEDLGTTDAVDLKITEGGGYEAFYRVIVPVNLTPATGGIRFRIRRETIDPAQSLYHDGTAYILLDNVICSEPAACVQLTPYGKYFPEKTRQNNDIVQGWEGAFIPAYPSVTDAEVFGRAKATMPDGSAIPLGVISSATMHYRWHYLEQRTTGWKQADLDPATLVTQKPLELPSFQGDIDFWFDAIQHGHYYVYADYSGTDHGLGDTGYTEEIPAVTNGVGKGWFVRTREAKSNYGELKLLVKDSEAGAVREEPLSVVQGNLWRGYYRMTNVVESTVWWRIEARNKQEDGAKEWNWSTNRWYVMDWVDKPPTFPAAGRMSEGTTNSWSRMTCDKQTGYLMFQVDETSLGVTAIHSDYQAFDKWNDAAGKGYFTGSSTEGARQSGTSSDVREYSMSYGSWTDTPATNKNWWLDFSSHTINESEYFRGYTTFSPYSYVATTYFNEWNLGKGMWVYGKYCEPQSHVALQMAGNGEGYVEFAKNAMKISWPRGLESVSFHARIAQEISPEFMAYNRIGVIQTNKTYGFSYVMPSGLLTNYTVMARTCFDMKENRGFAGNAALSIFAYYTRGVGAYEARWEQVKGKVVTSNPNYPTEVNEPLPDGQRLVIVRWSASGSQYKATELIATTNVGKWNVNMPLMAAGSATNNLMPFCMSVYQTEKNGPTYITAAVRIRDGTGENPGKGVRADDSITDSDAYWYFVTYKDTSSQRLQNGGEYGLLSSNCEGLFVRPQFRAQPTWPSEFKTPDKVTSRNDLAKPQKALVSDSKVAYADSYDEIAEGWWTVDPGRMSAFYIPRDSGTSYYDKEYGFSFVCPTQTVDVLAKSLTSTESWSSTKHLIGQVRITDFGQPGKDADRNPTFYHTSDSYVRLQTGGGLDDYRTDVVIHDVAVRQWRGWDSDTDEQSGKTRYDSREKCTNFVFTTGWITNGAVQLNAKRTPAGSPCSIRSPLLDGYKYYNMGVGLGGFRFSYREPQTNVHLLVQIVTNVDYRNISLMESLTKGDRSLEEGDGNQYWHTVTNLFYKDLWSDDLPEGATNVWNQTFGYHGAKGLMRVVIDPALVEQVSATSWTDTSAFGAIDITSVKCFDEPALDKGCWWGWNLQVVGDAQDSQKRMYLPDGTWDIHFGQSLALNNSTTADVNPEEEVENFRKHMPFLQSPTFTNAVIGQISFKARKYELSDYAPTAQVVVYGADRNPDALADDKDWIYIAAFPITNTIYTTYTCKTDTHDFYALRLAVVDVPGTPTRPSDPKWTTEPQRVLLDEVSISEAVRAMLSFRNVGAFRSNLDKNVYVEGVTTSKEQPLCDENWGIQAEVFATMLGDEIDRTYTPRVKLHWYVSKYDELTKDTWGWENWKSIKEKTKGKNDKIIRDSAWLAQTDGSNYVYRSSYDAAPAAIMDAQSDSGTVVQYMLEVEYKRISSPLPGETPKEALATNWLDLASWTVPEWYAPVDYNADPDYGAGKTFAAFNILDTVAPRWAWINEANVYGTKEGLLNNSDAEFQYAEVCVPMEADLTGWKVRFLEAYISREEVVTNDVAKFGGTVWDQAPGTKKSPVKYNKTFRSLGNKESDQLKKGNGTLDGLWEFSTLSYLFRQMSDGTYYVHYTDTPFGVQLVRPTGIIESSVVVMGTNSLGRLPGYRDYDPSNVVAALNRMVPGSKFFYAAEDSCGTFRSGSVMSGKGESASVWTNNWACSPGYLNTNWGGKVEQVIDPDHPTPHGDSIVIYATVDASGGPIRQWVGGEGSEQTNETEMVILKRGSARGTNIVYRVDPWYEIASVTTNDAPFWPYRARIRYTNIVVGVGASNNLRVVAKAQVDSDLSGKYGLTPDNPFTPAVMSWLRGGTDAYGNAFAHDGEISLAEYWDMTDAFVTNLTLTQMYCFDMDPTVSNLIYKAGMKGDVWPVNPPAGSDEGLTNVRARVFMMISNRVEAVPGPDHELRRAWSPYILRGLDPDFTSWDYKGGGVIAQSWTSETFKITGLLANGGNLWSSYQDGGTPLRWFVFHEDSFHQEKGDLQFTTDIEIIDPRSISSPGGAAAGWYEWCQEHGWTDIYYFWAIDMRLKPVGVEILQPTNFYSTVSTP